jgi:hypothetical protein
MSSIYCLYSTADGRPRYVGQTTKPTAARHARHLRDAAKTASTDLHRWILGVENDGFQVRAHVLQLNVAPRELNLFERYWMSQFAGLLNCGPGTPTVRVDTPLGRAVKRALRRQLQAEGPRILGRLQPQIVRKR